jgi:hypothetical protein
MAERGQITGALLDGPLAFDNAISKDAAKIKGIKSEVAGDPDILLARIVQRSALRRCVEHARKFSCHAYVCYGQ